MRKAVLLLLVAAVLASSATSALARAPGAVILPNGTSLDDEALTEVKGEFGPLGYVLGRAALGAAGGFVSYGIATGWRVNDSKWWAGAVASSVGGAGVGLGIGAASAGLAGLRLSWGARLAWDAYNTAKAAVVGWATSRIAADYNYRSRR